MPRPAPVDNWLLAVEYVGEPPNRKLAEVRRALGMKGAAVRPATAGNQLIWKIGAEPPPAPGLLAQTLAQLDEPLRPARVLQMRMRGEGDASLLLETRWASLPWPSQLEVRELHSIAYPRISRLHVRVRPGADCVIDLPATAAIPGRVVSAEFQEEMQLKLRLSDEMLRPLMPVDPADRKLLLSWRSDEDGAGTASFNLLIAPGPPERWQRLRGDASMTRRDKREASQIPAMA